MDLCKLKASLVYRVSSSEFQNRQGTERPYLEKQTTKPKGQGYDSVGKV